MGARLGGRATAGRYRFGGFEVTRRIIDTVRGPYDHLNSAPAGQPEMETQELEGVRSGAVASGAAGSGSVGAGVAAADCSRSAAVGRVGRPQ